MPGAATLILVLAFSGTAFAQAPQAATAEQIERAKEIYLPSAPHLGLAKLTGVWSQELEFASGGPRPVAARGTVTNRLVLDGRFVISEGSARHADGTNTGAVMIFGFDGRTREYTVIVLDTFGTYFVTASGSSTVNAPAIVMKGQTPERGGVKLFDVVLTWLDDDTYKTEIVFRFPGREPVVAVAAIHRRIG